MAAYPTEQAFNAAMCGRLKRARDDAGLTQKQMAAKIGVMPDAYAKYENRSPLPAHLIPRVCDELGMDCWYLLTGRFRQESAGRPFTVAS